MQATTAPAQPPAGQGSPSPKHGGRGTKDDLSGRNRVLSNVYSGWVANGLQIISGFILPRLISDRLGVGSLGVWDFGWAIVSYFGLLQGGIVSSVNRYVAKHRAVGDTNGLNVAVNSVGGVLKAIAIVIAVLSCAIAWIVPNLMAAKLAGLTSETRWVILLLGLTAAVQVQGAVYGGVITGCHRWTIQNGIKAVAAVVSVGGGIAVILLGGTIVWLAGVMLFAEVVLRCVQQVAARKICGELVVSLRFFSRSAAFQMFRFGGKTYVHVISQMLVNQTSSILVASSLGAPALAIFSRPRSLIRAFSTVVDNNAMVMVPMVSALGADGKLEDIRRLAVSAARYAAFGCLPAMLFLTMLGGDVMRVWMGEAYVDSVLLGIFAVAGLVEAMCFPLYRMMMGLDRHGRLGLMNLVSACVSVALVAIVAFVFTGGLRWIALAIAAPSVLVNAVLLPWQAARALKTPLVKMLLEIWTKPVLCCLPAALFLVIATRTFEGSPIERLLVGGIGAVLASGWPYWRHALPEQMKQAALKLTTRLGNSRKEACSTIDAA